MAGAGVGAQRGMSIATRLRDTPYRADLTRSMERNARKGLRPKGVGAYVNWLLTEWANELPDRMHEHAVWRGYASTNETPPKDHLGGSLSGSPAWTDPFRRYMENSPRELDRDGYFVRPLHAALGELAGRGPAYADKPFMARFCLALACAGGDWRGVCDRIHIPVQVQEVWTESALARLWGHWRESPDEMRGTA
jgi:hypothetical protein